MIFILVTKEKVVIMMKRGKSQKRTLSLKKGNIKQPTSTAFPALPVTAENCESKSALSMIINCKYYTLNRA